LSARHGGGEVIGDRAYSCTECQRDRARGGGGGGKCGSEAVFLGRTLLDVFSILLWHFYSFFLVGAVLIMLFMQCASLCAGAGPGGVPGTGA